MDIETLILILEASGYLVLGSTLYLYYIVARPRIDALIEEICKGACRPLWKQRACEAITIMPYLIIIIIGIYLN